MSNHVPARPERWGWRWNEQRDRWEYDQHERAGHRSPPTVISGHVLRRTSRVVLDRWCRENGVAPLPEEAWGDA